MFKWLIRLRLIGLLIFVLGTIGWIANIVKIIHHINDPLTAMEVFRMVGAIFVPLGALLGYF